MELFGCLSKLRCHHWATKACMARGAKHHHTSWADLYSMPPSAERHTGEAEAAGCLVAKGSAAEAPFQTLYKPCCCTWLV